MKSASDPRHQIRRKIVQELYTFSFGQQISQPLAPTTQEIINKKQEIDEKIRQSAPEWPVDKINKVDLSILRLAVWEIMQNKESYKVVIDEAVELAKEYGSENSPSFVNGVLGHIMKIKNE